MMTEYEKTTTQAMWNTAQRSIHLVIDRLELEQDDLWRQSETSTDKVQATLRSAKFAAHLEPIVAWAVQMPPLPPL